MRVSLREACRVLAWPALVLALAPACVPRPAAGVGAAAPSAAVPAASAALADTGGYRGRFNNHDQHHADLCVKLRRPAVALRYADGSPTGFELTPDLLVPAPGTGVWCPEAGMARVDARETVPDSEGRPMLFHRGGWGFLGQDPASAVHYGHLRVQDLDTVGLRYRRPERGSAPPYAERWSPAPLRPWIDEGQRDGNGSPCAQPASVPEHVVVRSIPADMKYLNSARTGTTPYAIYGDPSEDLGPAADRARGVRYTMLTWSWINVRGGGVARALVPDGAEFRRCADVPSIQLAAVSDAATRRHTGWVQAVYGGVRAGRGQWLFGWLVAAHRHGDGPMVAHLQPGPGAPTAGHARPAAPPESASASAKAAAPDSLVLPLWPATAADSGAAESAVQRPPDPVRGAIQRVTVRRPTLTLYRPAGSGAAPVVLVFPGGGYRYLAVDIEGTEVCRWLTGAGIACVLVRYRVPQPPDSTRSAAPLQDAQRALGLVRRHAGEWGIDGRRVGVLGFSAGAHLAATLSNQFTARSYAPVDSADRESCRPDFALLVYPAYLVEGRGAESRPLSPEVLPSAATPPTFLVQTADDPIGAENSLRYALALKDAHVPAELHMFAHGGHGYGLRPAAGQVAAAWPRLALHWLGRLGLIPQATGSP